MKLRLYVDQSHPSALLTNHTQVIHAEGELRSVVALKEAADMLALNPTSLKLRYLQVILLCFLIDSLLFSCSFLSFKQEMNNIAKEKNQTIVFPLPIEILDGLRRRFGESVEK